MNNFRGVNRLSILINEGSETSSGYELAISQAVVERFRARILLKHRKFASFVLSSSEMMIFSAV